MRTSLAWFLALTLLGCGDDGTSPAGDAAADAPPATCEHTPSLEPGDPDGHAEPLGAAAGEARAGRIEAAELPDDPDGLAVWAEGDFLLANDRIAALIEDAGVSDGYDPFGGKLVGLFRVEGGALVAPADFNEASTAIGRFTFDPESVTVTSDGSGGGAAVVRALGRLTPVPFIDPLVGGLIPGDYGDIAVAVDYSLEPGAEHVDVTYVFDSPRPRAARVGQPIHFFLQYKRMPAWTPVAGFEVSNDTGKVPFVAFVQDDATSFAWQSPDGEIEQFLEISGVQVFSSEPFEIGACGPSEHHFVRVHVGGPGLDGVLAAKAASEGASVREVTVAVEEADGSPAAGVRVHATSEGAHLTRATTGEDGTASLRVSADVAVDVLGYRRGDVVAGPVTVAAGGTSAELSLAAGGFVHVVATDAATSEALPVRVQVVPLGDRPMVPASHGEIFERNGRLHVEYPVGGDVTLPVPAGTHRVLVSRGYEYELVSQEVEVTAGETVEVTAELERVIDTTDVMCGDFHIHTHRSPDAEDHVRWKIASAIGDGLEIPVRSDHEWIADFEPVIADMGVEAWAYGVVSLELTTFTYGHFGVFPLDPIPTMVNTGAFDWIGKDPPEMFAEVRERETSAGQPTIIINHPRSGVGGFGSIGAYFDAAGYDPDTGMLSRPEYWDEGFSLVEVFNSASFDQSSDVVADWFSFLNTGRRVFAVGSSDSHGVISSPVGYPRSCIRVGTDDPGALRAMGAAHIRDTMLDGDFTVSGGIYVDAVAADGSGPGGDVTRSAETELVTVTVQAASWVDADTLRVFVDGDLIETITLDDTTADPSNPVVRFEDDVAVPVASGAAGSWVVFVASGDESLAPLHPSRMPFGVTNPIFFRR